MMHFLRKNTIATISDKLLNMCIDSGVLPKNAKGKVPASEEAMRCNKLAYFGMECAQDRQVSTRDVPCSNGS